MRGMCVHKVRLRSEEISKLSFRIQSQERSILFFIVYLYKQHANFGILSDQEEKEIYQIIDSSLRQQNLFRKYVDLFSEWRMVG